MVALEKARLRRPLGRARHRYDREEEPRRGIEDGSIYVLFLQGDRIYIVQRFKGAPSIHTPKALTDCAERFVKGCMEFARRENFRVVNLARANSLYSYHNPETRAVSLLRANVSSH